MAAETTEIIYCMCLKWHEMWKIVTVRTTEIKLCSSTVNYFLMDYNM